MRPTQLLCGELLAGAHAECSELLCVKPDKVGYIFYHNQDLDLAAGGWAVKTLMPKSEDGWGGADKCHQGSQLAQLGQHQLPSRCMVSLVPACSTVART